MTSSKSSDGGLHSMSSPRSTTLKRLEDGIVSSGEPPERRFPWKRLGVVVFIGLVYLFGPNREELNEHVSSLISPNVPSDNHEAPSPPVPAPVTTELPNYPAAPPSHDDEAAPFVRPTDPASDGDLTKTHYCTQPYKAGVPLVQFALLIDMGAVGSRIHIYKFNNCGPSPAYEYEVSKRRHSEMWKYLDSRRAAAESLDMLLDEALRVVPESLHRCTPLQVKVSGSLRMLGERVSNDILAAIRHRLEDKYPFSLQGENAVGIVELQDAGVHTWLTANYLLKTLSSNTTTEKTPPYAVLDLGAGFAQIVFEPTFDMTMPEARMEEGEHRYDLMYDGRTRVLYQHSHRGYGLVDARHSTHRLVNFMSNHSKDAVVTNPCLARGTEKTVEIELDKQLPGRHWRDVAMVGEDVGSWESCNQVVELVIVINKDAACEVEPCSFNGVYQPSLLETFPHGGILLLHDFYDYLHPFVATTSNPLTGPLRVSTFADIAKIVCQGSTAWTEHWGSDSALLTELERHPEWCLDLTYMHALLRLGYGLNGDREIQLETHIDGTELSWYLGATVATIAGVDVKCRV